MQALNSAIQISHCGQVAAVNHASGCGCAAEVSLCLGSRAPQWGLVRQKRSLICREGMCGLQITRSTTLRHRRCAFCENLLRSPTVSGHQDHVAFCQNPSAGGIILVGDTEEWRYAAAVVPFRFTEAGDKKKWVNGHDWGVVYTKGNHVYVDSVSDFIRHPHCDCCPAWWVQPSSPSRCSFVLRL